MSCHHTRGSRKPLPSHHMYFTTNLQPKQLTAMLKLLRLLLLPTPAPLRAAGAPPLAATHAPHGSSQPNYDKAECLLPSTSLALLDPSVSHPQGERCCAAGPRRPGCAVRHDGGAGRPQPPPRHRHQQPHKRQAGGWPTAWGSRAVRLLRKLRGGMRTNLHQPNHMHAHGSRTGWAWGQRAAPRGLWGRGAMGQRPTPCDRAVGQRCRGAATLATAAPVALHC